MFVCVCVYIEVCVFVYVCMYIWMYVCTFSSLKAEIVSSFFPSVCSYPCSYVSVLKVTMKGRHCQ